MFVTLVLLAGLFLPLAGIASVRTSDCPFVVKNISASAAWAYGIPLARRWRQGDYVAIYNAKWAGVGTISRVAKRVVCIEGQRLKTTADAVYCNGKLVAKYPSEVNLKHISHTGVIPAGKLFVVAEHRRSLDSRYEDEHGGGLIDETFVNFPLATFGKR